MQRLERIVSRVVPLLVDDIDTDQIIPARFLKVTDRAGLGDKLFADWDRRPVADGARILLAGRNFGCGSSREHAPWALLGAGFQVVIARSFADIFRANSLKNGLVPVALDEAAHARIAALVEANPAAEVTVCLRDQLVTLPDGSAVAFAIDPFARHCLLEGIDELGYLLSFAQAIDRYEENRS